MTGAGRGIGRALAMRLGREGAQLALLDTNESDLRQTAAECPGALGVHTYACNVTDEASVVAVLDRVVGDTGRLDGLVNNAGVVRDALLVKV
ncbi:MAG: SDR family NAD(P)-dependent oxidoreductase, partial [Gammaproteobacteria bacterium]|nr:SDR family NAD(P)-dependent oxidoreductase [Gammaproteobacteria bacterium]